MNAFKLIKAVCAWMALAGVFLLAPRASAQFTYTTNGGIVTLTGVTMEQSVVTIPGFVSILAEDAFVNDTALTSVTIPNNVTNVVFGGFGGCYALSVVNIGAGASNISGSAFEGCYNLQTINIIDGATSIENGAFEGIPSLKTVTIANSVTNIGQNAFGNDYALSTISLGSGLVSIGSAAFSECSALTSLTVPNSVTNIGANAFGNCTSLTNIFLGDGLIALGGGAFEECFVLASITIPNTVSNLGGGEFQNCYSLTNVTIGPCVSNLPSGEFEECFSLATITIAPGSASINNGAFQDIDSLQTVVLPNSLTNIGSGAFIDCEALSNVSMGDGVVSIGSSAFSQCPELTSIRIPDSVTNLGSGAFAQCTNLTSVYIGQHVTNLVESVFENCSSLRQVVIPASVTNLTSETFQNCTVLSNVYFQGNAPFPTNDTGVFSGTPATIYYLPGATGWGTNLDGRPAMVLGAASVQVTISPPGAIADGAFWRVDNGADEAGGTIVNNLFPGTHVISFVPIGFWVTPSNVTVTIATNQTAMAAGNYSGQGGALQVTISPSGAVLAGATWQVDGGADQISGALLTDISAGSHLVTYKPVAGWMPPPDQFVDVPIGGLGTTNGVYTAATTSTNNLVLVTNGSGTIKYKFALDSVIVGNSYTVTAIPAAGNSFDAWVGGANTPYVTLTNAVSYTFVMQSNLLLEANFVSNEFPAAQGTYTGLFAPAGAARTQTDSGYFTFSLSKAGAVSGKLTIGSEADALSGKFNPDGGAQIISKRHNENPLTTTLQLDPVNQAVEGTVTDGSFVAQLQGYFNPFTAHNKATNYEGKYTLAIPGTTNPAVGPAGAGYGTVMVSSAGAVSFAGSLADGTAVSQSSAISADGCWPLYLTLYKGKGSFWGWNYFSNGTVNAFSDASWINATNSSQTAALRNGFTNQQATIVGALFSATNEPLLNMTNGVVTLADGGLASTITNPIILSANNKIILTNAADTNSLMLTINKSTGVISGSFASPLDASKKISVNGVLLQNQTNAQGYFLNTGKSGAFQLQPVN